MHSLEACDELKQPLENEYISREKMKELISAHGGKNSGSISGKTTYLLAGEKAGPEKLKKAQALGIQVIGEEDFYTMTGHRLESEHEEGRLF